MPRAGRKSKKTPTLAEIAAIAGATEQRISQANGNIEVIRETSQRQQAITVRLADWPLASLAKSGAIDRIHEFAGDQYHTDAYYAGQLPSHAMDYARDKVDTSITDHTPDIKLDALDRFTKASAALKPTGHLTQPVAEVVNQVCLQGIHPRDIPPHRFMRRNERDITTANIFCLKLGLDALAVFYRLKRVA